MSWKDQNSFMCDSFVNRKHNPFHEEEWKRNIPNAYKSRCQLAFDRCKALAQIGVPIPKSICYNYKVSADLIDAIIKRHNARMGIMPTLPKDLPKLRFKEQSSRKLNIASQKKSSKKQSPRKSSRKQSPRKSSRKQSPRKSSKKQSPRKSSKRQYFYKLKVK